MIHPNVPYLNIGKRGSKTGTDLTSPKAWRVNLLIKNGEIYYVDNEENHHFVDTLQNGNQIKMGSGHLEMTIIIPVLKSKSEKQEIDVESVIKERCQFDQNVDAKKLIKEFKGR